MISRNDEGERNGIKVKEEKERREERERAKRERGSKWEREREGSKGRREREKQSERDISKRHKDHHTIRLKFGLVSLFYGISTFEGYLMPKPSILVKEQQRDYKILSKRNQIVQYLSQGH